MKSRLGASLALLVALVLGPSARGDDILLKDGRSFSGKFLRGDAATVEFRTQGKVETFRTSDVERILFREPDLVTPPSGRAVSSSPAAAGQVTKAPQANPPAGRVLSSDPSAQQSAQEQRSVPTVTLPAGTALVIRMAETVDTERHQVGDTFMAAMEEPLSVGSQVIVPRGAEVKGKVAYARESGRMTGQTELILELVEVNIGGRAYPLRTSDYSEVGASRGKRTAATIGGAAAVGAVIGAVVGGGKGAAVGAATGAAAGTAVGIMTRGQTIRVPAETLLDFRLEKPLVIDMP